MITVTVSINRKVVSEIRASRISGSGRTVMGQTVYVYALSNARTVMHAYEDGANALAAKILQTIRNGNNK